jgi:hypothetical protein
VVFLKQGYPQSSSIFLWDFPLAKHPFLGNLHGTSPRLFHEADEEGDQRPGVPSSGRGAGAIIGGAPINGRSRWLVFFFMFMSWRIRKYPKIIKMNGNYLLFVPWWIGKLDFLKRFQYQIQFANTWNYFHWTYHWNWNMVVSKIFPIVLDFCWHVHFLFSWLYSHYISWYSHSCWLNRIIYT